MVVEDSEFHHGYEGHRGRQMKREVSPIIGIVGILLALTIVQVLYWRGLIWEPPRPTAGGGGPGGGGEASVTPSGLAEVSVTTVAGGPAPGYRDGPSAEARFDGPAAVAVGPRGDIYVADSRNHCVRVVGRSGQVAILAGAAGEPGYADGTGLEARFFAPAGIAVAWDGSLLVADTGNHRIRRVTLEGRVSTYAGAETPVDDLGRPVGGYGDGPSARAEFRYPVGLAVDEDQAVYVADAGNGCVRVISAGGEVSTLPISGEEELGTPTELALGPGEEIWVVDTSTGGVWAGPREGPLKRLGEEVDGLAAPSGIAVLRRGSEEAGVYVADAGNHCLWQIRKEGLLLIAGQDDGYDGGWEDGPGYAARFSTPAGLASGGADELYVADFGNNCLRRVTLRGSGEEAD